MTKTIKYLFNIFILCFCPVILFSQQNKIDSLLSVIKSAKEDTNKVNTLNALGWQLMYNNPDTAILLGNQALQLCTNPKSLIPIPKSFLANTLGNLGVYYWLKSDYPKALDYYLKALKFNEAMLREAKSTSEKQEAQKGIAARLGNIGSVYKDQADYPKALNYYFKALKIGEELGDKNRIAIHLGNIGLVYWNQADYPMALDYYFRALKMDEELGNKKGIARHLGNIGIVYYEQASKASPDSAAYRERLFTKALDYYFRALKMDEELGNKNGIARHLGNIGSVYKNQADYPNALDYYFRALKMDEELGNKKGIAIRLGNIGSLYTKTGKFKEAEQYLKNALTIDKEIGAMNDERQFEESLSQLYDTTGRYKLALVHYKKAMVLKDTLFSKESKKQLVRKEMNYEFEKKEAATKAEQDKKDAVTVEEKRKQRVIIYSISAGLFLVLLLALFIFRGYKQKQKANVIITQQKIEVEKQKHIIEEKNKDITDSINYAQRIQRAILPHRSAIWEALPQSFVLYKPKDIVAGDFYWFHKSGESILIAAADCTGHGVPGAFTSMICSEKLNEAVKHTCEPGEILSVVNKGIKFSLKQDESKESTKDGMDIAFCSVDLKKGIIKYAGANRPLFIIRKGKIEIEEIKATKKAIGGFTEDNQVFETHTIQLQQGDTFYISSDGYADQDGGDRGKRLMTKPFKRILIDIQDKSMKEQKEYLEEFLANWRGNKEQLDDILVIGVRI